MSISDMGIVAVPVITVIVFLVAEAVKATPLDNKWLPVICGFFGGCLGVAAMFLMADFPAHDVLSAVAVGIVSGLAATGVHQIYKQLTKAETSETTPANPGKEQDAGEKGTEAKDTREEYDEYLGMH